MARLIKPQAVAAKSFSLVACGYLHDDSYKWVEQVNYDQRGDIRTEGPAVEIVLRRVS